MSTAGDLVALQARCHTQNRHKCLAFFDSRSCKTESCPFRTVVPCPIDLNTERLTFVRGDQESTRYFLRAMIFPVGLIWLALVFQVSQFFPQKLRWQWPKVLSTMGAVLQLGFSSISATALAPMMCYKHPNGLKSVLTYPGVICSSAEHDGMVLIAALLLVVFIFGFTALCTYIVVSDSKLQTAHH